MYKVAIKPLSINQAYRGRRFLTNEYKAYKKAVACQLLARKIPDKIELHIEFGFSSSGSDVDNCVKPFQDILSTYYGFNDNRIYKLIVEKKHVKKGQEYILWNIETYKD
jgi:Holliday junction resolvase RusA-like endonuclease